MNTRLDAARAAYLAALGTQSRVTLDMLSDKLGVEIEMDWESTARVVCSEALGVARELVRHPGPAAWALPECGHCLQVIAKAMCSLQIQAYLRLGCTPAMIAAICRQSAGERQLAPHP